MARVMAMKSTGGQITLDGSTGVQALLRLRGTGLPPVATQWFEGAGDGASFRGGRYLSRVMDVGVKVYGSGRAAVSDRMSAVGNVFALDAGHVRLSVDLDGEVWYTDVRRTGGGDWDWDSDTDGKTFIKTTLTVEAGDPFWTRQDPQSRSILPGGLGRGLIKDSSLAFMQVSTNSALGAVPFTNDGDIPVFPVWTITAPFTGFELVSPTGQTLTWGTAGDGVAGDPKASGHIVVNTELGTVVDELGANRYGGLGPVPRFWSIPRGASLASVVAIDAESPGTRIDALWYAKRWVMF